MTGSIRDHDALCRALRLYDQAVEAFGISPTEGHHAIMDVEHAFLEVRAVQCGFDRTGDLHAWATRRAATYREMYGDRRSDLDQGRATRQPAQTTREGSRELLAPPPQVERATLGKPVLVVSR